MKRIFQRLWEHSGMGSILGAGQVHRKEGMNETQRGEKHYKQREQYMLTPRDRKALDLNPWERWWCCWSIVVEKGWDITRKQGPHCTGSSRSWQGRCIFSVCRGSHLIILIKGLTLTLHFTLLKHPSGDWVKNGLRVRAGRPVRWLLKPS